MSYYESDKCEFPGCGRDAEYGFGSYRERGRNTHCAEHMNLAKFIRDTIAQVLKP